MARYLPLPKRLSDWPKQDLQELIRGTEWVFRLDIFGEGQNRDLTEPFTTFDGKYHWSTNKEFFKYVTDITSTSSIGEANNVLYQTISRAPEFSEPTISKTPEQVISTNRPTTEQLKTFIKEEDVGLIEQKRIAEINEKDIETAIQRKQEIYAEQIIKDKKLEAELKKQRVYYKVKNTTPKHSNDVELLKEQAIISPKKFIEQVSSEIATNATAQNLSPEESVVVGQLAAQTTYETLTEESPLVLSVVINQTLSDTKILNEITSTKESQVTLQEIGQAIIKQNINQFELVRQYIDLPADKIQVEISLTLQEGYKELDLKQQLISPHIENLNQQNALLDTFKDLGKGEIKSQLLSKAGMWIEKRSVSFPVESFAGRIYNSDVVKLGLSRLGVISSTPMVVAEGSLLGKLFIGTGLGDVAGFIQAKTGINLGVKVAEGVGAATTKGALGGVIGKGVVAAAAKVGIGTATITAIGQFFGSFAPIIGNIAAFIATSVVGKILEKIPWDKIKAFFRENGGAIGFLLLGGGFITGSVGLALLSAPFFIGGFVTRASLASFGFGIGRFFGAMGTAIGISIGVPILVFLLTFPVIVALILFIINSGAYIVPPKTSSLSAENPYIGVEKSADPEGPFQNNQLPVTINYSITVTAKKGSLTNISFEDSCEAIKSSGTVDCPTVTLPTPPTTIVPGTPFTSSYSVTYSGGQYNDSAIINTINVTADTAGVAAQNASGGASVIIGKPPTQCFTFEGSWNAKDKAQMIGAIAQLSKATAYMSTLCAGHTIPLVYTGEQTGYAAEVTGGAKILFHIYGLSYGSLGTLYTLAHETGHLYARWTSKDQEFYDNKAIASEGFICTYLLTQTPSEDFAEMIGLFVSHTSNTRSACLGDYKTHYPAHWKFARDKIFFSDLDW